MKLVLLTEVIGLTPCDYGCYLLPLILPKQRVPNTLNFVNNCFQSVFFLYKFFREKLVSNPFSSKAFTAHLLPILDIFYFHFWVLVFLDIIKVSFEGKSTALAPIGKDIPKALID